MTISNGTVSVGNPSGSASLIVGGGNYSTGTLTMYGGTLSSVTSNSIWYVGGSSGSTGSVWMSGGMVTVTNGSSSLWLGMSGAAQWTLSNGLVTVGNIYQGSYNGPGVLAIDGGTFSIASNAIFGVGSLCTGAVSVTGGQLLAPNGPFVLGNYSPASMTVSGGSAVVRSMIIASNNYANGSALNIAGGQVTVFDSLVVGDCTSNAIGQITVNGGTLYVTNATHTGYLDLRDGTLTISSGTIVVDTLVMTNACGLFVRNGGTVLVGSLMLAPNLSAIGDGIPNGWKQQYGLDPLDPNVANEDPDGDGMSNLREYLAGTDPTNSASGFRITSVVPTGSDVLVSWMTGDWPDQRPAGDRGGCDRQLFQQFHRHLHGHQYRRFGDELPRRRRGHQFPVSLLPRAVGAVRCG